MVLIYRSGHFNTTFRYLTFRWTRLIQRGRHVSLFYVYHYAILPFFLLFTLPMRILDFCCHFVSVLNADKLFPIWVIWPHLVSTAGFSILLVSDLNLNAPPTTSGHLIKITGDEGRFLIFEIVKCKVNVWNLKFFIGRWVTGYSFSVLVLDEEAIGTSFNF